MPKRKVNSRALRHLAEGLIQRIAQDEETPLDNPEELVTSLVRQWITYGGHATLFFGEQQVYLGLGNTPLGKPCIVPDPILTAWMKKLRLREDRKISPDDIPEVIDQLNRGQSAEVINEDGVPLRIWVNPKERSMGVEQLIQSAPPQETKRDYHKIASDLMEQHFGEDLEPEEMEELVRSVVKQWQQYEGHACLFVDDHQQLLFKLNERSDGSCTVGVRGEPVALGHLLSSLGFAPDAFPELIARINLGLEIEFRDRKGLRTRLWHDPKVRAMRYRAVDPVASAASSKSPPELCPKCTAVLRLWQVGERQQTCPLCGYTVSLS